MKITKFVHSCLLVEMPDRTALFDPGMMSEEALNAHNLEFLDDIFITHEHGDHYTVDIIKKLVHKFPNVRITSTAPVVEALAKANIKASVAVPDGAQFFASPHEHVEPLFPRPLQIGVHYLDRLTHPGDSHSFSETSPVLALPITAPWGSAVRAINLALDLKPQYVIPIHDWHWNDAAREATYDSFEHLLGEKGIIFLKAETGKPMTVDV